MKIIRKKTYARAGLLGNPSDGYNGRTIAISVRNFWAEVVLYEWDSLDIVLAQDDRNSFSSIYDLANDVKLHGYYGGIRLIKATIKRFVEHCIDHRIHLHEQNFSVRYHTTIPRQVGLAGSSAIIVSTLRCLMEFYDVLLPIEIQPSFVLSVEMNELGITAGLQDRVIQCYEDAVYMNFAQEEARQRAGLIHYTYERIDPALLPPLYLAYHVALSEPTERFHNDIRGRFDRGEQQVIDAMAYFSDLTEQGRAALLAGDSARFAELIDANYDMRLKISKLPAWQQQMINKARECAASAKFAGSGGAIIGTYPSEEHFEELQVKMEAIGSRVIKPMVVAHYA